MKVLRILLFVGLFVTMVTVSLFTSNQTTYADTDEGQTIPAVFTWDSWNTEVDEEANPITQKLTREFFSNSVNEETATASMWLETPDGTVVVQGPPQTFTLQPGDFAVASLQIVGPLNVEDGPILWQMDVEGSKDTILFFAEGGLLRDPGFFPEIVLLQPTDGQNIEGTFVAVAEVGVRKDIPTDGLSVNFVSPVEQVLLQPHGETDLYNTFRGSWLVTTNPGEETSVRAFASSGLETWSSDPIYIEPQLHQESGLTLSEPTQVTTGTFSIEVSGFISTTQLNLENAKIEYVMNSAEIDPLETAWQVNYVPGSQAVQVTVTIATEDSGLFVANLYLGDQLLRSDSVRLNVGSDPGDPGDPGDEFDEFVWLPLVIR